LTCFAEAQQPGKIHWIGYLTGSGLSPNQAFVQGMRDLGYVEGKNIGFVFRTTEGKSERYADLAAELVRSETGHHCRRFHERVAARQESHKHGPYCDDEWYRSGRDRTRRQLGSARRQCNRADKH